MTLFYNLSLQLKFGAWDHSVRIITAKIYCMFIMSRENNISFICTIFFNSHNYMNYMRLL